MVPTLLVLILSLTPPALPDGPAQPTADVAAAHAVLQVSQDFGAENMVQLVQSRSFAASIHPSLLPGPTDLWDALARAEDVQGHLEGHDLPPVSSSTSYVLARSVSHNLAALSVVAMNKDLALMQLQSIGEHLTNMRTDRGRALAETMSYKEDQLQVVRAQLAQLSQERAQHRQKSQGVDPSAWQSILQSRLLDLRSEQFDLASRVAVDRAMRDHLVSLLAKTPATVMREGPVEINPAYAHLNAQMNRARKEYDLLRGRAQQGGVVTEEETTKLLNEIEGLETLMGSTSQHVPGPERETPNGDYRNYEQQIIEHEQSLARNSVELATTLEAIQMLAKEVLQYQLLVDQERELDGALSRLSGLNFQLTADVEELRRDVTLYNRAPVSIVTGPTSADLR